MVNLNPNIGNIYLLFMFSFSLMIFLSYVRTGLHHEYIAPELFLLLKTSLFTFYVIYFPLSFFAVYIIIFLPVVLFTYVIHT